MNAPEQISALEAELKKLIDRFRSEFEIPYAVAIGVLQMEIMGLYREAVEKERGE